MLRTSTSIELELFPATSDPSPITQPPSVHQKGHLVSPSTEDLQPINSKSNVVDVEQLQPPGKKTTAIVLVTVVCVRMIGSMLSGVTAVALPTMARDLHLAPSVLLRLAQNGTQLIVFRALAGVAISFCLPSAVSIITSTFPEGKSRNIAFASMGGGQPIGFSFRLVLGGVFSDTIGWRRGFHLCTIINTIIFVVAFIGLPKLAGRQAEHFAGSPVLLLCIREPTTLGLLITALELIPAFIFWVGRQEKLGRPAIIPNSLWRNRVFSVLCLGVFITWGVFNAIETYLTLFFQDIQKISPIQTSIRFLPAPIAGAVANLVMGLIAHRVRADFAVVVGGGLTTIGALLMCVIQPEWTYWACAFPAVFLNPMGADALFTISNLVITSVFPAKTQGLAGGVFNTVAQIGKSVGLATSGVIAASITEHLRYRDKESPEALMVGFRAAFWYLFALSCATGLMFIWGLKGIGKIGMKRE
ncbi:MFS general substrate transporter [Setomelanomma holmii]|uniref:MFS general substrate transporter n=1 Tax=Setomelanomma holmii TaxID=210430 RepID=A0A9P4H713_9PLEO|nr:MFS general substrate transporter [Setomelanomma holmii]